MPKGSIRNPGSKDTSAFRQMQKMVNETTRDAKALGERYRAAVKDLKNPASKPFGDPNKRMKKAAAQVKAGRVALTPAKKTIRPATSAKKGK